MRILSIFVDESGDFGPYERFNPFYIFTLLFHDQRKPIQLQLDRLKHHLPELGFPEDHCFHAGPLIRREEDYQYLTITQRRRLLNAITAFARGIKVSYVPIVAEKKNFENEVSLTIDLSKKLSRFIRDNYLFFQSFDNVIVYYDNGQVELTKILASVFSTMLSNVEFRKVIPADYRLFQVADLLCTFELIRLKSGRNMLSKSEAAFFGNTRDMKKNYLKHLDALAFHSE